MPWSCKRAGRVCGWKSALFLRRGVTKRAAFKGWYSGTGVDSEDTLLFSQRNNVASMNEIYPLQQAQAAYDRMMSGKARFRVVLQID